MSSFLIAVLLFFQGLVYPIVAYAVVSDDSITTDEDTLVSTPFATLLGNDTDQTTITSVQSGVNGNAVINGTNVEFTPATDLMDLLHINIQLMPRHPPQLQLLLMLSMIHHPLMKLLIKL